MFRVLDAKGRLDKVWKVVPTVEIIISFNGRKKRLIEAVKNMQENPNGILLIKRKTLEAGAEKNNEYIGNLSTEMVEKILNYLLVNEYYDFSKWQYQDACEMKEVVLDGGESAPYTSRITKDALDYKLLSSEYGFNYFDDGFEACCDHKKPELKLREDELIMCLDEEDVEWASEDDEDDDLIYEDDEDDDILSEEDEWWL